MGLLIKRICIRFNSNYRLIFKNMVTRVYYYNYRPHVKYNKSIIECVLYNLFEITYPHFKIIEFDDEPCYMHIHTKNKFNNYIIFMLHFDNYDISVYNNDPYDIKNPIHISFLNQLSKLTLKDSKMLLEKIIFECLC